VELPVQLPISQIDFLDLALDQLGRDAKLIAQDLGHREGRQCETINLPLQLANFLLERAVIPLSSPTSPLDRDRGSDAHRRPSLRCLPFD
jgi:hypothetical protein